MKVGAPRPIPIAGTAHEMALAGDDVMAETRKQSRAMIESSRLSISSTQKMIERTKRIIAASKKSIAIGRKSMAAVSREYKRQRDKLS